MSQDQSAPTAAPEQQQPGAIVEPQEGDASEARLSFSTYLPDHNAASGGPSALDPLASLNLSTSSLGSTLGSLRAQHPAAGEAQRHETVGATPPAAASESPALQGFSGATNDAISQLMSELTAVSSELDRLQSQRASAVASRRSTLQHDDGAGQEPSAQRPGGGSALHELLLQQHRLQQAQAQQQVEEEQQQQQQQQQQVEEERWHDPGLAPADADAPSSGLSVDSSSVLLHTQPWHAAAGSLYSSIASETHPPQPQPEPAAAEPQPAPLSRLHGHGSGLYSSLTSESSLNLASPSKALAGDGHAPTPYDPSADAGKFVVSTNPAFDLPLSPARSSQLGLQVGPVADVQRLEQQQQGGQQQQEQDEAFQSLDEELVELVAQAEEQPGQQELQEEQEQVQVQAQEQALQAEALSGDQGAAAAQQEQQQEGQQHADKQDGQGWASPAQEQREQEQERQQRQELEELQEQQQGEEGAGLTPASPADARSRVLMQQLTFRTSVAHDGGDEADDDDAQQQRQQQWQAQQQGRPPGLLVDAGVDVDFPLQPELPSPQSSLSQLTFTQKLQQFQQLAAAEAEAAQPAAAGPASDYSAPASPTAAPGAPDAASWQELNAQLLSMSLPLLQLATGVGAAGAEAAAPSQESVHAVLSALLPHLSRRSALLQELTREASGAQAQEAQLAAGLRRMQKERDDAVRQVGGLGGRVGWVRWWVRWWVRGRGGWVGGVGWVGGWLFGGMLGCMDGHWRPVGLPARLATGLLEHNPPSRRGLRWRLRCAADLSSRLSPPLRRCCAQAERLRAEQAVLLQREAARAEQRQQQQGQRLRGEAARLAAKVQQLEEGAAAAAAAGADAKLLAALEEARELRRAGEHSRWGRLGGLARAGPGLGWAGLPYLA
jgi:hypothetical protein